MLVSPLPLRERVGCGGAARLCGNISSGRDNRFSHAFHIVQDVDIPETQNAESLAHQPSIALVIGFTFCMLTAICLGNRKDAQSRQNRLYSDLQLPVVDAIAARSAAYHAGYTKASVRHLSN